MKYLFICLIFGLFAYNLIAQTTPKIELIINNIKIGTSYPSIVKQLGKPLKELDEGMDECTDSQNKKLIYEGLEITVAKGAKDRDFKLLDMKITSVNWVTDKGIKIGASPRQVMTKYGKTRYEKAFQRNGEEKVFTGEMWLMYEMKNGPGSVTFYFKNNQLIRVELEPTVC